MNIKKKRVLVIAMGMLMLMSTSVFAHGHGGGHHSNRSTTTKYAVCGVSDCNLTYNHSHNGTTYAGHHSEDGHQHYYN